MNRNYEEVFAVTLEGDDKQQVWNKVFLSNNAEYYLFVPQSVKHTQNKENILESSEFSSIEELDAKIQEHVIKVEDQWTCNICKYQASKAHVKAHVETHFDGRIWFPCEDCDARPKTRSSLRSHKHRKH